MRWGLGGAELLVLGAGFELEGREEGRGGWEEDCWDGGVGEGERAD